MVPQVAEGVAFHGHGQSRFQGGVDAADLGCQFGGTGSRLQARFQASGLDGHAVTANDGVQQLLSTVQGFVADSGIVLDRAGGFFEVADVLFDFQAVFDITFRGQVVAGRLFTQLFHQVGRSLGVLHLLQGDVQGLFQNGVGAHGTVSFISRLSSARRWR
ncbi:hypothetical protein D3C73_1151720 [compost metagenome]